MTNRIPNRKSEIQASQSASPPIEIHDLTVSYDKRPVLWNIDVALPEGQIIGVIGPNGAGKSTLIKAVLGLLPVDSGWVRIYGEPLTKHRNVVGYVPQRESVDWDFPVTVRDVVLMGTCGRLGLFRRPGAAERACCDRSLEQVEMAAYADRQISNLSGGQRQRVFLARALAQQSRIYLLDEPFVGVDAATESAIIELLRSMKREGRTLLVVHHDLQTVPQYFDSLLMLNMRLVAFGPTQEVFTEVLLQKTYGGRLTILSEAAEQVAGTRR
ncbi:MAG: metal ABC transporter ATP-binding protein [Planctomycetaceae bacterium]|nr:metal ABC transporter ATP-binding protein [Planctomycetaceae bacterium]